MTQLTVAQQAVAGGEDPAARARVLRRARDAAVGGGAGRVPAEVRPVIRASWSRVRRSGVDPSGDRDAALRGAAEVERWREESGLAPVLPVLRERLLPVAEAAGQLMVVADAQGCVLWAEGGSAVRRRADRLGFVVGSSWDERSVGTDAIGTSLVTGGALQVFAAEHWAETHQPWTCAAAPPHDAAGRVVGAVELSGPARTPTPPPSPSSRRSRGWPSWRSAPPASASSSGCMSSRRPCSRGCPARPSSSGWTGRRRRPAGSSPPTAWRCPTGCRPGRWCCPAGDPARPSRCPAAGCCGSVRRRPRPADGLVLDPTGPAPRLRVTGTSGSWTCVLTLRHAEILLALAQDPAGPTAAELADDLFGDASRTVTVRAEVSRLRRTLGPLLAHQLYRFADPDGVELRLPPVGLLPASTAPVVARLRPPA